MEIIQEKTIVAETEGGVLELSYTLYSMPTLRGTGSFGILLRNRATGESDMISDITGDLSAAVHLFEQLVRGKVTPVTLRDVVEDFVADLAAAG